MILNSSLVMPRVNSRFLIVSSMVQPQLQLPAMVIITVSFQSYKSVLMIQFYLVSMRRETNGS